MNLRTPGRFFGATDLPRSVAIDFPCTNSAGRRDDDLPGGKRCRRFVTGERRDIKSRLTSSPHDEIDIIVLGLPKSVMETS